MSSTRFWTAIPIDFGAFLDRPLQSKIKRRHPDSDLGLASGANALPGPGGGLEIDNGSEAVQEK
jgi:hypothetical protein